LPPTTGSYSLLGGSIDPLLQLDNVGYMPEHDCLPSGFTAVGFVSYMGQLSGLPSDVAMERTHDILDYVGMGEARYRKIKEFSTGMKQKVKLAQALVHDPELVFFDEPTNGLDPEGRKEMLELLRDVASIGKSIVLSSHLLPDIEYVCKDVIILDGGKVLLYDSLDAILGSKQTVVRIKGDRNSFSQEMKKAGLVVHEDGRNLIIEGKDVSGKIFRAASRTGAQVRYMSPHSRSLEDIFLQVVGGDE
ncbi:MAG: ABC transporter ATP-binding protein, partial [Candidatus Methanofastidiosia archaeon]